MFDTLSLSILTASPSSGGDVEVYVFDKNQPSLPTPFYSVPVSVFVVMARSIVFHCINAPENSPLSLTVFPVLFLLYWSFELEIFLSTSPSALV